MKTLIAAVAQKRRISSPVNFAAFAMLAVAFWFSTGSPGMAQDPSICTYCHKRTTTQMLPCTSLEYRRHLDHGDTIGACAVTPTQNP